MHVTSDQINQWIDENCSEECLSDYHYYYGLHRDMFVRFLMDAINHRFPNPILDKTINTHVICDKEGTWLQYYFIVTSNGSPITVKKLNRSHRETSVVKKDINTNE